MRRRVYIAGPISKGDLLTNVNQATAAFIALAKAGLAPFCPHWSVYSKEAFRLLPEIPSGTVYCEATSNGNAGMTHADWLDLDLPWVRVSEAVLRLPGESVGADREVAEAEKNGTPVFYSVEQVIAWDNEQDITAAEMATWESGK